MDKGKVFLAQAKKHYFWVLFGLAVVIPIACWFLATGSSDDLADKRRKALKSAFDDTSRICQVLDHPNEVVITDHENKTKKLGEDVLAAWKALYEEQKSQNRLPDGLKKKISPAEFEQFQQAFDSGTKLSNNLCESYQSFIGNHLPNLWARIKCREPATAKTPADGKKGGGAGGAPGATPGVRRPVRTGGADAPPAGGLGGGMGGGVGGLGGGGMPGANPQGDVELVGIVDWDQSERNRIKDRFKWTQCPSDLKVRLAQEDLWVYEALLRVIEKVNETATAHHNAPIKRIINLEIGLAAGAEFIKGRDSVGKTDSATSAPGAGAPASGPAAPPSAAPAAAAGAVTLTQEEETLLKDRYVDVEDKPLAANAIGAEFKMMPVLMRLVVQQKMIPKLLVECANSSMPIEVRLVRLGSRDSKSGKSSASGGAANPAPGAPSMGGMAGAGGMGNTEGSGEGRNKFGDTDITELDMPVEIQGVIYIFNPPDKARFGLDKPGDAVPGTPDAGTTPAGTTPATPAEPKTPTEPKTPPDGARKAPADNAGKGADEATPDKATPDKATPEPADESKGSDASPGKGDAAPGESGV